MQRCGLGVRQHKVIPRGHGANTLRQVVESRARLACGMPATAPRPTCAACAARGRHRWRVGATLAQTARIAGALRLNWATTRSRSPLSSGAASPNICCPEHVLLVYAAGFVDVETDRRRAAAVGGAPAVLRKDRTADVFGKTRDCRPARCVLGFETRRQSISSAAPLSTTASRCHSLTTTSSSCGAVRQHGGWHTIGS
jgi:hypothetical protein